MTLQIARQSRKEAGRIGGVGRFQRSLWDHPHWPNFVITWIIIFY